MGQKNKTKQAKMKKQTHQYIKLELCDFYWARNKKDFFFFIVRLWKNVSQYIKKTKTSKDKENRKFMKKGVFIQKSNSHIL